ncbi:MAG: hypothetical protein ASARMPRED_000447 [Alectoria sarmentosa]|nr:MAG: hypothetical protein ASARMPRED_000447 [Alectoria sarmentosa]
MKSAKSKGYSFLRDAHMTANKPQRPIQPWSSDEDGNSGNENPSADDEKDEDGIASEASSRREDHRDRVKAICHQLWPFRFNRFQIERVQGGGFHYITAITVEYHSKRKPLRLILREKQSNFLNASSLEDEVTILRYLGQHTRLAVPKVKAVDFTADNALKGPYVIVIRIPGRDLDHLDSGKYLSGLSQEQRCSVAREWANMLLEIEATSGPMPGRIKSVDNGDGTQIFEIVPFQKKQVFNGGAGLFDFSFVDEAGVELPGANETLPFKSTLDWFLSQFRHWTNAKDPHNVLRFERLSAAATQMDAAGYMGDNRYTVYHPDLLQSPGNVMIEFSADRSLSVSGILDWDGAVFYPSFYGCEMPIWMWDGEYKYDEYGNFVDETPATPEQQQIKQIFEKAVGPGYLHRAWAPGYGLARQLIPWAESGRIGSQDPDKTVNDFLDTWGIIRPPGTPPIPRIEKTASNTLSSFGYRGKPHVNGKPEGSLKARHTAKNREDKTPYSKGAKKTKRPPSSSSEADREEEFEVDHIVDAQRFARRKVKYKIKWTGYDELTWQAYSDIEHLQDKLRIFESKTPNKSISSSTC